jgi:hypothetical protein
MRALNASIKPQIALAFPWQSGHNDRRFIRTRMFLPREDPMKRLLPIALLTLASFPALAPALEIKNIRPCYAPFGATRYDLNLLPGDVIFITYDLEGLAIDPKTGKTNYETTLEFIDDPAQKNPKVLYQKTTPNEPVPQLGTGRMPGDLHLIMGPSQAPGKYGIRLTVHDKIAKEAKAFTYPFNVVPQGFGFVGVSAPAVGFPGQHYVTGFGLVNLALDGKKQPNCEINIKILDEKGKPVAATVKIELPRDMPEDTDLNKANFVPLQYPIYLNRPGRFTIEIEAHDKFGNKKKELRYPVTVLDVNGFVGK